MLRFAEELLIFLLDKQSGQLTPVPDSTLNYALAGTVLMDLALEDRIDTDLERLVPIVSTPLNDDLLDPALKPSRSPSTVALSAVVSGPFTLIKMYLCGLRSPRGRPFDGPIGQGPYLPPW